MEVTIEVFQSHKKSYEDSDDEDDDYSYDDYIIEDEDEQIKEEMTPPKVVTCEETSLKGVVVVFKHDWSTLRLRKTSPSAFDHPCTICDQPFSTGGNHRVCCLPCGHMYEMSCINSLLQLSQSSRKCPTCNTLCTWKDVRLLYPARTAPTLLK
nr:zinc finger, RING/FYVE/PHD-type [Tanacetum cinerariifolium]